MWRKISLIMKEKIHTCSRRLEGERVCPMEIVKGGLVCQCVVALDLCFLSHFMHQTMKCYNNYFQNQIMFLSLKSKLLIPLFWPIGLLETSLHLTLSIVNSMCKSMKMIYFYALSHTYHAHSLFLIHFLSYFRLDSGIY